MENSERANLWFGTISDLLLNCFVGSYIGQEIFWAFKIVEETVHWSGKVTDILTLCICVKNRVEIRGEKFLLKQHRQR